MDKISIQITVNSITSPELLQYLTAIERPKHRSEMLRRLAEIGLGVMATPAAAPFHAGRQPFAQVAPASSRLRTNVAVDRPEPTPTARPALPSDRSELPASRPAAPANVLAAETIPAAADIPAMPAPSSGLVAADSRAGATPPPFALDLNSAMDRFF